MPDTELSLGDFIRRARVARGLSQRRLSLNAGLSPSYVGKIEAGENDPSFRAVSKLAVELGLNAREVFLLVKLEATRG